MKIKRAVIVFFCIALASVSWTGCQSLVGSGKEIQQPYAQPITPIPLRFRTNVTNLALLTALPNETMSVSVGQVKHSGEINYAQSMLSTKGASYVVALDYAKFVTRRQTVFPNDFGRYLGDDFTNSYPILLTVNIGVGLRVTATFTALEGNVMLGSLYGLGLAAQANKITGTLMVQTIGLSGESISSLIPMPSEISPSTIQNAIQALATAKAKMYDTKDVIIAPQIFSIEAPGIPIDAAIRMVTSEVTGKALPDLEAEDSK